MQKICISELVVSLNTEGSPPTLTLSISKRSEIVRLTTSMRSTANARAPRIVDWHAPIIMNVANSNGGEDRIWNVLQSAIRCQAHEREMQDW